LQYMPVTGAGIDMSGTAAHVPTPRPIDTHWSTRRWVHRMSMRTFAPMAADR